MTVQPIKNDQAVVPLTYQQPRNGADLTAPATHAPVPNKIPDVSDSHPRIATADSLTIGPASPDAKDNTAASRLASTQDDAVGRLTLAKAVRAASAVDAQMEKMKQGISQIVNSYPPFLRGSEQHVKYLMSISSIREQIEAMTIPPTPATGERPGEVARIWGDLFTGIQIPALTPSGPNEATDAEIRAAGLTLNEMQATVVARRSGLQAQALPSTYASAQDALKGSISAGESMAATGLSLSGRLGEVLKNY